MSKANNNEAPSMESINLLNYVYKISLILACCIFITSKILEINSHSKVSQELHYIHMSLLQLISDVKKISEAQQWRVGLEKVKLGNEIEAYDRKAKTLQQIEKAKRVGEEKVREEIGKKKS